MDDEKSFNLHLRKQYIIDEIQKIRTIIRKSESILSQTPLRSLIELSKKYSVLSRSSPVIKNLQLKLRERIEHFANNENSSEETVKACEGMLMIFDNILDQESISYFEYEPGENIRDIEYFEVNERIPTTDIEKINTVIKTVSRGYRLEGLEDQHIIIKKAKIDCNVEE